MSTTRKPIRVGLILDNLQPPCWIHSFIEQLCAVPHLRLVAIVLGGTRASCSLPLVLRLWTGLEQWCFGEPSKPLTRDLKTYAVEMIRLAPVDGRCPVKSSYVTFTRIRALDLDVLVQLGQSKLPEEIQDCAKYGIWTVRYSGYGAADPEHALLSILYAGHPTCELVLRSVSTGSHNYVLYRSSFHTHKASLYKNLMLDRQRRSQIVLRRLFDLFDRGWTSITVEEHEIEIAGKPPRVTTGILFLAWWAARCLRHAVSRLWFEEQWIVASSNENGSVTAPKWTSPNRVTIITPPPGQNYADPFLFARDGRTYMFFEHWHTDKHGAIWCAELGPDGVPAEARQVLARDYHLSYPFVFEWRGEAYVLPETQQNRTVEVYRAIDFPWRWERAAVLLRNITAVDPTIFEYKRKLWLFVAGIGGTAMNCSELSLFFADSLFGEWQAHPKNPIVCDVRKARPGGALLVEGDVLIRPGQDCSSRYGHAITLNKVEVLSETDYREVTFATILPNWMPGICATHTMNRTSGIQVLDAKARFPRYASLIRRLTVAAGAPRERNSLLIGNAARRLDIDFGSQSHSVWTRTHAHRHVLWS